MKISTSLFLNRAADQIGTQETQVAAIYADPRFASGDYYDHPDGEARLRSPMWRKQEAILRRALRVRRPATVQRSRS